MKSKPVSRYVLIAPLVITSGCAMLVKAATQTPTADLLTPPNGSESTVIVIIIGFLSMLATQGFALWREYRNRNWDLEDRSKAREEIHQRAEDLKLTTSAVTVELMKVLEENRKHVMEELQKNTAITESASKKADAAYNAGNNFNEKLLQLSEKVEKI